VSDTANAQLADPSALTPAEEAAVARIRRGPGWLSGMVRYLGLLVFFGVWQIISAFVLPRIDANLVSLMPPPTEVVKAAIALLVSGELLKHFLTSLQR